jgi:hypothetical protein
MSHVFLLFVLGLDHRPELLSLVGRREKVEYCETVTKYDRRFKVTLLIRNHILTLFNILK